MDEEKVEQKINLNESDLRVDSPPSIAVDDVVIDSENKSIAKRSQGELLRDARKSPAPLRSLQTEYPALDKAVYLLITFTMSMFFFLMAYSTVWGYPWQSDWGHATGKITFIKMGYKLWRHVYYTYEVNSSPYTYHQGFQIYGYCVSPGQSVHVRYRPDAPSISVIQTGANPVTFLYFTAGIILILGFAGGISSDFRTTIRSLGLHEYR